MDVWLSQIIKIKKSSVEAMCPKAQDHLEKVTAVQWTLLLIPLIKGEVEQ